MRSSRHHFTNEENGLVLHHYWTNACRTCALKAQCTNGPQRRIKRGQDEYVVDAVQARLDRNPMQCVLVARRSSIRLAR